MAYDATVILPCDAADCWRPATVGRFCAHHRCTLCDAPGIIGRCARHPYVTRRRIYHRERREEYGRATWARQAPTCRADDCDRPTVARSLCWGHYRRFIRRGHVEPCPIRRCAFDGRPVRHRGLCKRHYWRLSRYGDPLRSPNIAKLVERASEHLTRYGKVLVSGTQH